MTYQQLLAEATTEAEKGLAKGGIPIGSVLADSTGRVVSRGHNLRVQTGDPTAHAEMVCMRNAGRRSDWHRLTLVTTLSPCIMCAGTALLHRIPRVVIGESTTYLGEEELLRNRGVELIVLDDQRCIGLMRSFMEAHPDLWNEDIGRLTRFPTQPIT